jgi:hypothetical protein
MYASQLGFGEWTEQMGVRLSRELNMTDDAHRFENIAKYAGDLDAVGLLSVLEGKTIHQFSDRSGTAPRYVVSVRQLVRRPQWTENARYFRAACREVASSTNERTVIAAMLPPGVLCGHTISVERKPARRPNAAALSLVGVMNSFPFDWLLRQKAAAHVSLYILSELPVPELTQDADRLVAHTTLRLCCNHRGFASLWREQLGDAWREEAPGCSWPAVAAEADRWRLRAAMDAVIAHAYGLDRAQYARVLAGFSHKSFGASPALCLAAFDEFERMGAALFCRNHDPYFDIPLVTNFAEPVIPMTATEQRSLLPAGAVRAGSTRA